MATTYTVKKGDTLWGIAQKHNTTYQALAKLNNLDIIKKNGEDYVYLTVGQVIKLSGTATAVTKNTSKQVTITIFGEVSSSSRELVAIWSFDRANTKEYTIEWQYRTNKSSAWLDGNISSVTRKQCTYTPPADATNTRFRVKPVSDTYTNSANKTVSYWTGASWTSWRYFDSTKFSPVKPSVPTPTITDTTLSIELTGLGDLNASIIQFDVAKDGSKSYKTKKVKVSDTNTAKFECSIDLGSEYQVSCRSYRDNMYSDWTEYSDPVITIPAAPKEITLCQVGGDETSVHLEWTASKTAEEYVVQYTKDKSQFSSDTPIDVTDVTGLKTTTCDITGLEKGATYYLRVKAKNTKGDSAWTAISSTNTGDRPIAPLVWSDKTTVKVGEPVTLYWTHQSKDSGDATYSDLELYVNGVKSVMPTINHTDADGKVETDQTKSKLIDTSSYEDGAELRWRVRTAGSKKEFGDWSALQLIDVYAEPVLSLVVSDTEGNEYIPTEDNSTAFTFKSFPITVSTEVGLNDSDGNFEALQPILQSAIGYHISVVANQEYSTTDNYGNPDIVNDGEIIFSRHYDSINESKPNTFSVDLTAGDIKLETDVSYTLTCKATLDSGLSAEASIVFLTSITDLGYSTDAEISFDEETYTATIKPYCDDANGNLIENVLLYVYRREYDGTFTEIAKDIENGNDTYVIDPHPALDYARYRITAVSKTTGEIMYNDIPAQPVGCKSIIIQWDEQWTNFNVLDDGEEVRPYSGSLLKLDYNIDVSDKYSPDVSLIAYIGRDHPVSYYGTQRGESSTWNVVIRKDDKETIYALRRLAKWRGNAYVREPSGLGYWANVTISFNQKHRDLTIPVTIEVTRVEGGA